MIAFNAIHGDITWALSDDGTLSISGTGDMNDTPWCSQKDKIKRVVIENGVTSIGAMAFYNCSVLTSVTIPNSVTSIGEYAFYGCSSLTSISFPKSVTSIGIYVLYGCSKMTEIYSWNAKPTNVSIQTFEGLNTMHLKLFVPEGSGDTYKFATGWMNFFNIYEMEYAPVLSEAEPTFISDSKPSVTKGYYKEKTVTYVREENSISKDCYASFCLPFAVDPTDAQFQAVYVPVGMALYNTEQNTLRIGFYKEDKIIPAGTPFLALLAVDDKVEIKNALPVNYDSKTPAVKSCVVRTYNFNDHSGIMSENSDYAINFSGTYKKVSPANANTFNTDGSVGASSNVAPYRAYVALTKNNTNAKIITSFDEETVTTGINDLQITNDELPVYDLNGRMVNGNTLKSGIYIKNGKKFIK